MKKATAYKRGGSIYMHALSKTTAGVWVLSAPVSFCAASDEAAAGRLLVETLNGSRQNVPHPSSWKGLFDPVLQLAGVKSVATFNKSAKCTEIESDDEIATVVPTRNLGPDEGYEPLPALAKQQSTADESRLGFTLIKAFEDAR